MNLDLTTVLVALVPAVALVAIVAIAYRVLSKNKGTIKAQLPGGASVTIESEGPAVSRPGSLSGQDLAAGGNIEATGKTGGDVEISRAQATGDIKLGTENPPGPADPK